MSDLLWFGARRLNLMRGNIRNGTFPSVAIWANLVNVANHLTAYRHKEVYRRGWRLGTFNGLAGTNTVARWRFRTGYGVRRLAYECEVRTIDYARPLAIMCYELGDPTVDEAIDYYSTENIVAGSPIYDNQRQRMLEAMSNMHRSNGGLIAHWGLESGAARTRTSATPINLIDNSTTGNPTSTSPGYRFVTTARNTESRSVVPIEMAVYGSIGAGSGFVSLTDTSGTDILTVEIDGAAEWYRTTGGGLSVGTGQKYDLRFYSDGSNALSVYAVSIQELDL